MFVSRLLPCADKRPATVLIAKFTLLVSMIAKVDF